MDDYNIQEILAKVGGMSDRYWVTIGEFVEQLFNTKNPAHAISKAIEFVDEGIKAEGDSYDFHEYIENIEVGIWVAQNRRIRNSAGFTDKRIAPNPDPIAGLAIIGPNGKPIIEYIPYGFEINHVEFDETYEDDAEIMGMNIVRKTESYDEAAIYATTSRTLTDLTTEGHIEYDIMVPLSSVYQCLVRLLQHPEVTKWDILYAVSTNGALISINSFTVNADMKTYPSVQINCISV